MLPAMVLAELIGESHGIAAVRAQVARLVGRGAEAGRLPPVLLQGETGTGKGLVARALHAASPRKNGPFVDVNCAAIPETLLEAEMFGVERGAFTGADRARPGLFQAAHRGTLFLDEIGLVPEAVQSKLLKAIEERTVRRLGRAASEPVDVWIVAATSEDLGEAMRAGRFRRDLYHRLAVLTLRLPPLRERGADVVLLAEHFLEQVCTDYGLPPRSLTDGARAALQTHGWPGNVRELANVLERAALLSDEATLGPETLGLSGGPGAATAPGPAPGGALRDMLESAERERLLEALRETGGNLSRAATLLQIPRNTLRYRMERHGLRVPPPSRRSAGMAPVTTAPAPAAAVSLDAPAVASVPSPHAGDRRRLAWLRAELGPVSTAVSEFDRSRATRAMAAKIHGFGGAIASMDHGGVTAAFGLEPVEDAPRRAALAALAVQKAAARARRDGEWPWPVTTGIHVDDGIVIGGERGAAVESASAHAAQVVLDALVAGAPPDAVVTTEAVARYLERRFELSPLPRGAGAAGPVLYRLTGTERPGLGLAGRITRFVGRQQELGLLESRLASARAGRGSVVAIVGEPGIGKTRLLHEFQQRFGAAGVTHLEGRCGSYASAIPYLPIIDLARQYCGIAEADGPEAVEAKTRRVLERLGLTAGDDHLYLLHLFGVAREPGRLRDVNPQLMKARTFEVLRQLVLRESQRRPVVLVVEDLHWIDTTSDELLALLVESVPAAALLLIATCRTGYQPSWLARSYATQVALSPLSGEDSRVVLTSALASAAVAPAVADTILAKAEGNPFFLEELARAVGERADPASAGVPDTIQSVLMARISRLADEDRRVLQGAAVIGRDVPVALLEAVAADGGAALSHALQRLQAAEFLCEARPRPDLEYTFKHALTQDVAYASLEPDRRRTLHARAARALVTSAPDTADRRPELVARHLTAADLPAEAIGFWLRAGRSAIQRSANVEAITHLGTGLELLAKIPDARARDRQELELQVALGPALIMTKGYAAPEVEHLYARAHTLSQGFEDMPQAISATVGVFAFRLVRGELRAAQETAERLLTIARASGRPEVLVEAHFAAGVSLHHRGRLRDARKHLETSIALYDPRHDAELMFEHGQDPWIRSTCYLAYGQALQGHEAESLRNLAAVLQRAEEHGRPFSLAEALYFGSVIHELRREFDLAGQYAEREIALAREHRFPFWFSAGTHLRGRALAVQGRPDEGLRLMSKALAASRAAGARLALPYFLSHIADAHRAAGNAVAAFAAIEEGLAAAENSEAPSYAPELLRLRGELLAAETGRDRDAEASFEQAVALAQRQEASVLARRAAVSLAAYLRARVRSAEPQDVRALLDRDPSPGSAP